MNVDKGGALPAPVDHANDPVTPEVERVSRVLLKAVGLNPDALVDGEPLWRHSHHVERAVSAIYAAEMLTARV